MLKPIDRAKTKLYILETCRDEAIDDVIGGKNYPSFKKIQTVSVSSAGCSPLLPDDIEIADYTVFLGDNPGPLYPRLWDAVVKSLQINTFQIEDFYHLGQTRMIVENLTQCQEDA